ncbi:MAG: hypothetical protein N2035_07005 [Chthoniobacterales bacterium]|nr:hypothetical protein [Chthoniobacterales bacterium]
MSPISNPHKEIDLSPAPTQLPFSLSANTAREIALRIQNKIPSGGLFANHSWLTSPYPFPLPVYLAKDLEKLGYRLWKFLKACNLLYHLSTKGKAPSWIAQLLDAGKPQEIISLGRAKLFREQVYGVIRPDIILSENGYFITEIDNVPGGIGLTAWFNEVYSGEGFPVLGGHDGMLNGFSSILQGGADIFVSNEASSYRPEMEWLASALTKANFGTYLVRSQDWQGPWQPKIYRFFELFDLPNIPSAQLILNQAAQGKFFITPPPKAFLEEKLWFALFWLKPLENFWQRELGSGIFHALQKVIPRTWLLNPEPLPPQAVYPGLEIHSWCELENFSQKKRQLVIKISGFSEKAWGARGVVIGHDIPSHQWIKSLHNALNSFPDQPYILQEYRQSILLPCHYLSKEDDAIHSSLMRARICPFYFANDKQILLGGALVTLCPADKKILHGMKDAVLCPATTSSQ